MSSIGAIWLVCDLYGTNFYTFYGRFEETGVLEVEAVFHWLYEFGLDVLLGIEGKCKVKIQIASSFIKLRYLSVAILEATTEI